MSIKTKPIKEIMRVCSYRALIFLFIRHAIPTITVATTSVPTAANPAFIHVYMYVISVLLASGVEPLSKKTQSIITNMEVCVTLFMPLGE